MEPSVSTGVQFPPAPFTIWGSSSVRDELFPCKEDVGGSNPSCSICCYILDFPEQWKEWLEDWIRIWHEDVDEDDWWMENVERIRPSECHSRRDFRLVIESFYDADIRVEMLDGVNGYEET